METTYYFDMLPVRLPVEPLESLTSYLTRLSQANGILSVDGIAALCFPSQDRRITREYADYSPISSEIVQATGVNEEALSRMTFFHLGMKFGRSPKPQPLSRFLAGSVAPYIRYCPHCLASQRHPYYSLLWRCLDIRCCTIHRCGLLDRCGHCNAKIPLLAAPLEMGVCPRCRSILKLCQPESSSEAEVSETSELSQIVGFLLSPLTSDEINLTNIAQRLGLRFKYERKAREVTALEMARQLGVTLSTLEGIERGDVQGRGAKFQNYMRYARLLGLSLQQVYTETLQGSPHDQYEERTQAVSALPHVRPGRPGYQVRSQSQRLEAVSVSAL